MRTAVLLARTQAGKLPRVEDRPDGELRETGSLMNASRKGFLLVAAALTLFAGLGSAATIRVDSRQTNQPPDGLTWQTAYASLAGGLALAQPGDELWVAAVTYQPFTTLVPASLESTSSFEIPAGVAVYGGFAGHEQSRTQRDPAIHRTVISGIRGEWSAAYLSPRLPLIVFPPTADAQTRLDGFRLEFNPANYGSAIHVRGGSPVIANNTIVSNRVDGPLGGSAVFVERTATLQPIDPLAMFRQVAGRLFATDGRIGSDGRLITHTNILVWPTNDYDAAAHRVLQVAANLVDAKTNRGEVYPFFPTVFRPYLRREVVAGQANIYLAGHQLHDEVAPDGVEAEAFVRKSNYWDLRDPDIREQIPTHPDPAVAQPLTLGLPLVLGATKGLPNFNELAMETSVYLERRIQVRRPTISALPNQTNEFYILGITNVFAVEAWNSYQAAYPRPLTLAVEVDFDMAVLGTNQVSTSEFQTWPPLSGPGSRPIATNYAASIVIPAATWVGRQFQVPLMTNYLFLSNSLWLPTQVPRFVPSRSNLFFPSTPTPNQFHIPDWTLAITNRLRYVVLDGGRIIDYVNLDRMIWSTNLIDAMTFSDQSGRDSQGSQFWNMRRRDGTTEPADPTLGVWHQLLVSMGYMSVSQNVWRNYSARSYTSQDEALVIDAFRRFMEGWPPSPFPGRYNPIAPNGLSADAPFSPARRLELKRTFEVNDPLVHFTVADISPPPGTRDIVVLPGGGGMAPMERLTGISRINRRYTPWLEREDPISTNEAHRDPLITHPDAWRFAEGVSLSHGWFDRIHRGTPWQTIYYGGGQAQMSPYWSDYSHPLMLPQNDRRWIEEFRKDWLGLPVIESPIPSPVVVNNTFAYNSAGNQVIGPAIHLEAGTAAQVMNNIVAFNAAGIEQSPVGSPFLLANNVFGNPNGDYLGLAPGLRDLQLDPEFHRAATGDFTLATTSPLIDAAHPLAGLGGWLDNDEAARWQNGHFDIGAAELSVDLPAELHLQPLAQSLSYELELRGFPGRRYRLEHSADFKVWLPVGDFITADGRVTVPFDPAGDRQFLRAVKLI